MRIKKILYKLAGFAINPLIIAYHNIENWFLKRSYSRFNGRTQVELLVNDTLPTCLSSIQYSLENKTYPTVKGYLFQSYPQSDSSLYYCDSIGNNIKTIAKTSFNLLDYNISLTPSGIIIATPIAKRGKMYVIKDGCEITLFQAEGNLQPCGWLYNTGIDYLLDDDGNEICVFAEYGHSESEYYVWRGKAPYNHEALWEKVFCQEGEKEIHHFHQIKRDPWTGYLYLTSGDNGRQNKWWYSKDCGITFTIFNSAKICNCEPNVLRMTNFVFTEKYVYWATDSAKSHSLNRMQRSEQDGLIDVSSRKQLATLPYGQATNAICFIESLNALFLYERVAWSEYDLFELQLKGRFSEYIYMIDDEKLYSLFEITNKDNHWGGHRGKCYQLYATGRHDVIMGFSYDTPCIMTNLRPDYYKAGSIVYKFI